MIQKHDEIGDILRHQMEEASLLVPFHLGLGPLLQAMMTIGHFLLKFLDVGTRIGVGTGAAAGETPGRLCVSVGLWVDGRRTMGRLRAAGWVRIGTSFTMLFYKRRD